MYHEIKVADDGAGWFVVMERGTPRGPWVTVARVFGEARAERVGRFLRESADA